METLLAKGDGKGGEKALSSWEVSDGTSNSHNLLVVYHNAPQAGCLGVSAW